MRLRRCGTGGLLVVALAFWVTGCLRTPGMVEIVALDAPPPRTPIERTYEDAWQALEFLDFAGLERLQLDGEVRQLADALQALWSGDPAAAAEGLEPLAAGAADETVREAARSFLGNALYLGDDWVRQVRLSDAGVLEPDPLAAAFSSAAPERWHLDQTPVTVPLRVSASGSPMVDVVVNGVKRRFWIDTGAGLTVVASDLARAAHLEAIGNQSVRARTGTSAAVAARPAVIERLEIGALGVDNLPAIVIDRQDLEFKLFGLFTFMKIDGILGWNAIKKLRLTVDYGHQTVTWDHPGSGAQPAPNLRWMGVPLVQLAADDGTPLYFVLDTGASATSLSDGLAAQVPVPAGTSATAMVGSAGGFEQVTIRTIPEFSLTLGANRIGFKGVEMRPHTHAWFFPSGLLGGDVLGQGVYVVDFQNGRFDFQPSK